NFGGYHTISAPLVLNSNTQINIASQNSTLTVSGNISGVGTLRTFSPGGGTSAVILGGTNSYSGGTTILGGNLQLASDAALPAGTNLTMSALDLPSPVLDLNGHGTSLASITVLTGPQTIPSGAKGVIINTSFTPGASTLTYAGVTNNPSTFYGSISDNAGSLGNATALSITSGSLTLNG